jgi:nucleoside-diphosphate-sugar epimerase
MISEPALKRPYKVYVEEDVIMPLLYIKDGVDCLIRLYEADNSKLKRRVNCIAGFSPTAKEIYNAVKKALPNANIQFKPDRESMKLSELARPS